MRTIRNSAVFALMGAFSLTLASCQATEGARTDSAARQPVAVPAGVTISTVPGELPSWLIPNIGEAAEAYYGPDSEHLIAQVQSPLAVKSPRGMSGFLTKTFTDSGTDVVLVNEQGLGRLLVLLPGRQAPGVDLDQGQHEHAARQLVRLAQLSAGCGAVRLGSAGQATSSA